MTNRTGLRRCRAQQTVQALGLVALIFPGACQASSTSAFPKPVPTAGSLSLPGTLVYSRGSELVGLEIATRTQRSLARFPASAVVGVPAASPDGRQIAFSLYQPSVDPKEFGAADLYLVDAAGNTSRMFLAHDGPGISLYDSAWSPDGQAIYFTRRAARYENGEYQGEDVRIERIGLDGTGRRVIQKEAASPTISPDGQLVAYLAPVGGNVLPALWVAAAEGGQPRRLGGSELRQIGLPRFAPGGGAQIVFAAVGVPSGRAERRPNAAQARISALLGPTVAHAHGVPWDLWLVGADGSGLTRLTDIGEDSPKAAWSPDGAWIAFTGELGLYLVNVKEKRPVLLSAEQAIGITWLPD